MLNQPNESQAERIEQLLKKIGDQPEILDQMERILQIVENETGEAMTADEAEELLVWEMRRLGQIAMGSWARRKESRMEAEYNGQSRMVKREKKR